MKDYKFLTSEGWVGITVSDGFGYFIRDKSYGLQQAITCIRYGKEHLDNLFKNYDLKCVEVCTDGVLWVKIDFSDDYYGSPEYLIVADDYDK